MYCKANAVMKPDDIPYPVHGSDRFNVIIMMVIVFIVLLLSSLNVFSLILHIFINIYSLTSL